MPALRRQQNFHSTIVSSCCREFKFQYNGLQYELAPEVAKVSLLRSQIKGEINFLQHTPRTMVETSLLIESNKVQGIQLIKSRHSKADQTTVLKQIKQIKQISMRPKAIVPLPKPNTRCE